MAETNNRERGERPSSLEAHWLTRRPKTIQIENSGEEGSNKDLHKLSLVNYLGDCDLRNSETIHISQRGESSEFRCSRGE